MTVREYRKGDSMLKVKRLYKSAFPKEERKPFTLLKRLNKLGKEKMLGIFDDNDEFLGLVFVAERGGVLLVDYLATVAEKRNTGIGREALKLLDEAYPDKVIVIEIEDTTIDSPDKEIRMRRKSFYERCGYTKDSFSISLFGVRMEILTKGGRVSFEDYKAIYSGLLGEKLTGKYVLKI